MIFNQLTIQGFKTVAKAISLDFSNYNVGPCAVTGDNQAEPRLGSNGAGKSTIWDALCWCYFGKDTKGHTASKIVNWYSDEKCEVAVDVEINDIEYNIVRTQSPNTLSVNGEEKTQEQLVDLLGLNYQSFMYLIVIPQFSSKFFDLQPGPKLEIFSSILDLDIWLKHSKTAKEKADEVYEDVKIASSEINTLEGKVSELDNGRLSAKSRIESWKVQQSEKIRNNQKDIDESIENRNSWQDQLDGVLKVLVPLQEEKTELLQKRSKLEQADRDLTKSFREAEREVFSVQYNITALKDDQFAFSELEGICPHCDQEISKEYLSEKLESIEIEIEELDVVLQEKVKVDAAARLEVQAIHSEQRAVKENLNGVNAEGSPLEKTKNAWEGKLSGAEVALNIMEIASRALELEENPFIAMEIEYADKLKIAKRDRRAKKKELKALYAEYELYKYWIKGFKEVRLFVIEEALLELELQMNNSLETLGLHGWEIKLAVDFVTGAGTLRKGFTVLIKSPHNEELVPFTCYSGGESARLRVAGTLGFADFISSRTGINPNIEVWDEATSWMSNEGVKDLVGVLVNRAEDLQKTIFVIDHRDLDTYGEFVDSLHIIKEKEGSRIA